MKLPWIFFSVFCLFIARQDLKEASGYHKFWFFMAFVFIFAFVKPFV